MRAEHILEVRGISMHFPGVQALSNVDFAVRPGEIHALIGANGAGKSTLIKILAGVEHPDDGAIFVDGQPVVIHDAHQARQLGLAFIHQELALVGRMTVAENLMLGNLPNRLGLVSRRELRSRALRALAEFLPGVDPAATVDDLPVAQQWLVSLARVTLEEAQVVFLDEPTAALGVSEVDVLFDVVRGVVKGGASVVFVSHRLPEILGFCDRVTALRAGRQVGSYNIDEVSRDDLVELISGQAVATSIVREISDTPGDPILEVEGLWAGPLRGIDFVLRRGEVLGIAGLVGAGRSELLETLFGARSRTSGSIRLGGESVDFKSPADAVGAGIAMLPEDRREQALFSGSSIRSNVVVAHLASFARGILKIPSDRVERKVTDEHLERLDIRATGSRQLVAELSGGNQQKVVVARWLCGELSVLLADEPTKGVDVAGKAEILRELRELAAVGVGVIVVSSEFEEVAEVADRVIVLREGRCVAELDGPTTENEILQACFGESAA